MTVTAAAAAAPSAARPSRRKALVPLATLLAAASIAMASGAAFVSQSVNADNNYTAGTLTQANSRSHIFQGTNLQPGDRLVETVTISNTGSLASAFTVTEVVADTANRFSPGVLKLRVTDLSSGQVVFDGNLGEMGTRTINGNWAAPAARTFEFVVTMPAGTGNDQQGRSTTSTYTWDATQVNSDRTNPTVAARADG